MLNLILVWSKKNNIDYLACTAATKSLIRKNFNFRKSINFSYFSDNATETNVINKLDDIQYIDSDLDFI
jgi:hypothetical protein